MDEPQYDGTWTPNSPTLTPADAIMADICNILPDSSILTRSPQSNKRTGKKLSDYIAEPTDHEPWMNVVFTRVACAIERLEALSKGVKQGNGSLDYLMAAIKHGEKSARYSPERDPYAARVFNEGFFLPKR